MYFAKASGPKVRSKTEPVQGRVILGFFGYISISQKDVTRGCI